MPSMTQSSTANMTGWQLQATPDQYGSTPDTGPGSPGPKTVDSRSPYLLSYLPMVVSSDHELDRQFYNGANVPTFRTLILP
jgi:hypothetical protein